MSQRNPTPGRENVTPRAREEFLRMLAGREQVGIRTYGTTLQTFNGRDAIQDAKEELIDAWQYLVQIEMERAHQPSDGSLLSLVDKWTEAMNANSRVYADAAYRECIADLLRLIAQSRYEARKPTEENATKARGAG